MKAPRRPDDEQQRLSALRDLELLDTTPEERFDRLTRIAKSLFDVPIALVSLVDEDRQWFKSRQGLDACETHRNVSFCGHAILESNIFEIPHALEDERFADNPLVAGPPHIRFYAGAPLTSPLGYRVGTLCIIDTRPRSLTAEQRTALRDIANCVENEFNNAVEQLRISKNRLAAIIEGTHIGTWEWNVQTGATRFNERWANIVGYTLQELEPVSIETWTRLAHPDDLARSGKLLEQHFAGELDYYDCVARMRHKDGHWVWVHDRGRVASWTPDGKPLWMSGTHADVTAQKLAEERNELATQQIQRQLEAFTVLNQLAANVSLDIEEQFDRALRVGIAFLDMELGIISRIRGTEYQVRAVIGPADMDINKGQTFALGDTYCDLVIQQDSLIAIDYMQHSPFHQHPCYQAVGMESYIGAALEVHNRRYGTLNFSSRAGRSQPFSDSDKLFLSLLARWVAATFERDDANQAMKRSEERLRALFELSPIGIALNDYESGRFLDLNPALLAPTGYTRDEFINLSFWDITPTTYADQEEEQLIQLRDTGRYGPYEKEYIRKDGTRYPVLLNGMLVHDSSGQQLIWSMVEDISERKRMERMKDEFVSVVSHELRTPLTAIAGALNLLSALTQDQLGQQGQQMLDIARRNSERLTALINDLLDIEKLGSGKMQFTFTTLAVAPIIRHALENHQTYCTGRGIRLTFDPPTAPLYVCVDQDRLMQVLANLLSNAIKFSPENGEVRTRLTTCRQQLRISVTDRGPGIPQSFHEHIFDKFSQADSSSTRQKGGTGLGLAISRELVEHMHGTIGFESNEGEGATFWVELPLAEHPAE